MNKILLLLLTIGIHQVKSQTNQLFPIEIKGKWGYMNQVGAMVIDPRFDLADDFNEGKAVVALNNLPCVINEKGKVIIDTGLYRSIGLFSEGLSYVKDFYNHKFYIDDNGNKIIELSDSIYDARPFHHGLAVVGTQFDYHEKKFEVDISTIAFRFAYINKTGKYITPFKFDDADDMQDGIARIKSGTLFGWIDSTGVEIVKPKFNLLDLFFENKAAFSIQGKWGFVNRSGEIVIKPVFDLCFDFHDGMAGIMLNGKYGFINQTGKVIIDAKYDQIQAFSEGKAAVMKDGKWGFINTSGEMVIPFRFDNASVFSEGMCAVLVKRHWGFINNNGNLVISAEFDAVGSFENGVADVVYHNISLYTNRQGTILPRLN